MHKVLLVAWREFKHTALTKAFIIAAVIAPLGIVGLMTLMPMLMKTTIAPLKGTIAVVDPTGEIAPVIQQELMPKRIVERSGISLEDLDEEQVSRGPKSLRHLTYSSGQPPQIEVTVKPFEVSNGSDLAKLKDQVRDGDLLAVVVIPADAVETKPGNASFELFVASDASPHHTALFESSIAESIVQARVRRAGSDLTTARQLLSEPNAEIMRLGANGAEARESAELKMIIPVIFMILLWVTTFTSGNYLLTSTIEEKSNKVMEVLLSAVSPFQLMAGKILGQAGVAFVMLLMYGGAGLAAMTALAMMDLIPPILLVYLLLYFIMAFFMIASIMAGVGSAVSELRDAQSLITPAMLVLTIPILLWLPISNSPNGVLATVTSYIPPLTPFVMILRVTTATEPVPVWQIATSLIAGYCWMIVMVWASAKIFRVGVLMYGKPPTPLELLKWVGYR
jgi:ABC-2 type transport system permease protein